MKGSEAAYNALVEAGVKHIFGLPGAVCLGMTDQFHSRKEVKHVLIRHETSGAHMAEGYSRASNRVGTGLFVTGPGATNAMTGLINAYTDSIPMVMIVGEVPLAHRGKGAVHESNNRIFDPVTKWNVDLDRPEQIPYAIDKAFKIAKEGRPGPVRIGIPTDFWDTELGYVSGARYSPSKPRPDYDGAVQRAAQVLLGPARPLILAGGGVMRANATKELIEVAELLNAPVATTWNGKSSFPEDHPLAVGVLGYAGARQMEVFAGCDAVLAVGVKFSTSTTAGWTIKFPRLVHIDIDINEIGHNYPAEIGIVGDAKDVLAALAAALSKTKKKPARLSQVGYECRQAYLDSLQPLLAPKKPVQIPQLVKDMNECLSPDDIVVSVSGLAKQWAESLFLARRPGTFITLGNYAVTGACLGLAVGAAFANPDRRVVQFVGDGGILMSIGDLATIVENNLNLVIVVLNDGGFVSLRLIQEAKYGRTTASSWQSPDFAAIARAFGAYGVRVEDGKDFGTALKEALSRQGPTLIDVILDSKQPHPAEDFHRALVLARH